jgi:predicted dehydrogenase
VGNEDVASALLRFGSGAHGTLTASRVAVGEQCSYRIEVRGTRGALSWDFRRMGELQVCVGQDYQDATWARRLVRPGDGDLTAFQPGSGIAMSFDDLKVVECRALAESIRTGRPHGATIDDAVVAAELVEAMVTSYEEKRWVST